MKGSDLFGRLASVYSIFRELFIWQLFTLNSQLTTSFRMGCQGGMISNENEKGLIRIPVLRSLRNIANCSQICFVCCYLLWYKNVSSLCPKHPAMASLLHSESPDILGLGYALPLT
jgi:hypothetical protein